MSLFQGDVIIRTAIELAVEDIQKNSWLIDDIFSDFITNPLLNRKYGQAEINRAKEFILNNKINYYMKLRTDKVDFPAVTIAMGHSDEDKDLATLGDLSVCVQELDPCEIKRPIAFIVKPFSVESYDQESGVIQVPENTEGFENVQAGMIVINPETGVGFVIDDVTTDSITIAANSELDSNRLAVIPKYQTYRARRERIISQESYNIGCHTHGDPSTLIFLYSVVKYALLRYREGLFENNEFQLGTLKTTDMIKNEAFGEDRVYSRFIVLSGQVQEDWIKTPHRIIEDVSFAHKDNLLGPEVGIRVLSNEDTIEGSVESQNDLWATIDKDSGNNDGE